MDIYTRLTFQPVIWKFRGKDKEKAEVVVEAELIRENLGKLGTLKVQLLRVTTVVLELFIPVED
jgi:hypothetical protein